MRSRLNFNRRSTKARLGLAGRLRVPAFVRSVTLLVGLMLSASGCSTVMVSATNPVPGLTTVAVAPFFNLSAEPAADGRRFSLAYFAELQKNPGFQVIPVGVVEQAINDNNLSMSSPADVMELARLLNVDAVVVGAITEYSPYYPPQIGLQVQWYSPRDWVFYPGIPGSPNGEDVGRGSNPAMPCPAPTVRGQSIDDEGFSEFVPPPPQSSSSSSISRSDPNIRRTQGSSKRNQVAQLSPNWPNTPRASRGSDAAKGTPASAEIRKMFSPPNGAAGPAAATAADIKPLMSYTRIFHGLDPDLQKAIKAYVIYSGDLRSGGWEAYLQRSDDFLKFTAHQMIVEMLALHGGTLKTESVITCWK